MSHADRSPILAAPVLFLVFNRPDTTRDVFQTIRRARPPRLCVAAYGPRQDRQGERERCESVREIATDIDWPCELHTLFRTTNLGSEMAVSGGISWFFQHEAEGIILEDDVLPDPTFFRFCGELLERYRLEAKVMMISGNYLLGPKQRPATSYYFSRYTHIWGWASWRRAWSRYDRAMSQWPTLRSSNFLFGQPGKIQYEPPWKRSDDDRGTSLENRTLNRACNYRLFPDTSTRLALVDKSSGCVGRCVRRRLYPISDDMRLRDHTGN
jgi:hypothetical protein